MGKVPDTRDGLLIDPGGDELRELVVRTHDGERPVPRADQLAAGFGDPSQQHRQAQVGRDRLSGGQQTAQPILAAEHVLRLIGQLLQLVIPLESANLRGGDSRGDGPCRRRPPWCRGVRCLRRVNVRWL